MRAAGRLGSEGEHHGAVGHAVLLDRRLRLGARAQRVTESGCIRQPGGHVGVGRPALLDGDRARRPAGDLLRILACGRGLCRRDRHRRPEPCGDRQLPEAELRRTPGPAPARWWHRRPRVHRPRCACSPPDEVRAITAAPTAQTATTTPVVTSTRWRPARRAPRTPRPGAVGALGANRRPQLRAVALGDVSRRSGRRRVALQPLQLVHGQSSSSGRFALPPGTSPFAASSSRRRPRAWARRERTVPISTPSACAILGVAQLAPGVEHENLAVGVGQLAHELGHPREAAPVVETLLDHFEAALLEVALGPDPPPRPSAARGAERARVRRMFVAMPNSHARTLPRAGS